MAAFWRDVDHSPVTVTEAIGEWSLAAWGALEDVAARWRKTITADQLAIEVQKRTGILTSLPADGWIGPVISLVAQRAAEDRGLALTAFVVDDEGRVLDSYRDVLKAEGREAVGRGDLEDHAGDVRMTAHRAYGACIPAGVTALPRKRGTRDVAAPAVRSDPKPKVCPRCYLVLPATGQCDNCN